MAIRYWLVVQPLDRARRQIEGGYLQLPRGRREGLAQMREADGVALYSPRRSNPDGQALRAFVGAGRIEDAEAYGAPLRLDGPVLWRRRARWSADPAPAPLRPLRDVLELTRSRFWGERLQDGLVELSRRDFEIVAEALARPAPEPSRLGMGLVRPAPPERPAGDPVVLEDPW